jgi:putative sigma-54 modulation protein
VHLQAQERAATLERAVDLAAQVLTRQTRQHKGRLYQRSRPKKAKAFGVPSARAATSSKPVSPDGEIARTKRFVITTMSAAEALKQMNALGHGFYLYQDAELDQVAVLYRRRGGDYGLILPEFA